MGDTKKPTVKVRDYRLYELERIAADAVQGAQRCIKGRRVDIERLILEKFKLNIESFADLRRRWDAYAFIDTTARVIFIDADLMNEERFARKCWATTAKPCIGLMRNGQSAPARSSLTVCSLYLSGNR